ncbi:uncharacterized protein (TIGR02271 family) [Microvirga lupini]|uniref:Uncharacterized protein (TIGR02271 family) n=1 Tax=Microvirga lupini TaxID=420324 RepID=A0A7W4VLN1_9HYPH|nr:DUF2382 domain-containing protein [Microvirga lupini]MBB3019484.1 uncharacterized protein (TIGR02271 family) [Microvirga lupini]
MSSGMTTGSASRRLVTAFFDSRTDAEQAISRLHAAGIAREGIRLTASDQDGGTSRGTDTQSFPEASAGLWDSLRDLFLPDEDRHTYAEGLRRGGYLVSVHASEADYERVIDILDDEGTIDIDERSSSWRSEGWTGTSDVLSGSTANLTTGASGVSGTATSTGSALGAASTDTASARTTGGDEVIPVAEEELHVGKRDVSHGRVRIRSYVVERPVEEQVTLREERVAVERRPVSGTTQAGTLGGDAFQERTIEVEERGEEAVVSKEARVTEEVVVRKQAEQRTETISDTVRRTEVDVEDERGTRVSGTGTNDVKP